jgi:hypothetical protein
MSEILSFSNKQSVKNVVFRDVVPCRSCVNQVLHGATSQKTAFFKVTAVKTSNLNNSPLASTLAQESDYPEVGDYQIIPCH